MNDDDKEVENIENISKRQSKSEVEKSKTR